MKASNRNTGRLVLVLTGTLLLSLALTIALSEVLLRAAGFQPWVYSGKDVNEPTMHEPDPVLGWQNKAGSYLVPPYHPSGQAIQITLLENGQRRTGVNSTADAREELVLVGDSLTQGWAISDHETYAWKLQKRFPFLKVLNYGTGGYGSYQSLLMLERELPGLTRPKFVLYGFIDHHEIRNCAAGEWLQALSSHSRRAHVDVPFVTFDAKKGLVRHSPERYPSWPFRESFASVKVLESAYMKIKTMQRCLQRRLTTEQILLQMNRVSEAYDATFIAVLLRVGNGMKEHYINFLRGKKIQVFDCVDNISDTDEMKVPGEGHPNGAMNTLWAECISARLKERFEKH